MSLAADLTRDCQSIASQLRTAPHTPNHPSYRAFVAETLEQYRALIASGLRISTHDDSFQPYADSHAMMADVELNNHLWVYAGGSQFAPGHLLAEQLPEFNLTANEVFRAVHDINGHYQTRAVFETFEGEIEAYLNHARMYSNETQSALFGETIAQLCHYYAGYGFVPVQRAVILDIPDYVRTAINR